MIELSAYSLELLRNDKEFNLYRGRSEHNDAQILVLSPAGVCPAPETLKRLEHEYSFREELEPAWAARPLAITHLKTRAAGSVHRANRATGMIDDQRLSLTEIALDWSCRSSLNQFSIVFKRLQECFLETFSGRFRRAPFAVT